jgi:MATE family multidrug resistance protein
MGKLANYKTYIQLNGNFFVRTMLLMFVFAFVTSQGARQGDILLAVNTILLQMQFFMAYGLDGFAHAAEALVGKSIGECDEASLQKAVRTCMIWGAGVSTVLMLGTALGGKVIVTWITSIPSVHAEAWKYLPWVVLYPILSVWSFIYDGIYIGALRGREMRNTMLFSVLGIFLPAFYIFRFLGNHGLWLAFMLFMVARGGSMYVIFRRMVHRNVLFSACSA